MFTYGSYSVTYSGILLLIMFTYGSYSVTYSVTYSRYYVTYSVYLCQLYCLLIMFTYGSYSVRSVVLVIMLTLTIFLCYIGYCNYL
jgi:hypothetical protein